MRKSAAALVFLSGTALVRASWADTTYAYDALGRLSVVTYDDGKRVTYVYDPSGNRTTHYVENTVVPPTNLPPVAVADSVVVDQSTGYVRSFDPRTNDSDPNADALAVTARTNGTLGTVTIGAAGTSLTYSLTATPPSPGASLADSFSYTISDGNGGTASATVNVSITTASGSQNRPPVANADAASVNDSTSYIRTFDPRTNDTDPDGDLLAISSATNGSVGVVAVGPGGASISYTFTGNPPAPGASTTDTFTYTVSDGRGGSATATVTISIATRAGGGGGGIQNQR